MRTMSKGLKTKVFGLLGGIEYMRIGSSACCSGDLSLLLGRPALGTMRTCRKRCFHHQRRFNLSHAHQ